MRSLLQTLMWTLLIASFILGLRIAGAVSAENGGPNNRPIDELFGKREKGFEQYLLKQRGVPSAEVVIMALPSAYLKEHSAKLIGSNADGNDERIQVILDRDLHIEVRLCESSQSAIKTMAGHMATSSAPDEIIQRKVTRDFGDIAFGDAGNRDIMIICGNVLLHMWAMPAAKTTIDKAHLRGAVDVFLKAIDDSKTIRKTHDGQHFMFEKDLFQSENSKQAASKPSTSYITAIDPDVFFASIFESNCKYSDLNRWGVSFAISRQELKEWKPNVLVRVGIFENAKAATDALHEYTTLSPTDSGKNVVDDLGNECFQVKMRVIFRRDNAIVSLELQKETDMDSYARKVDFALANGLHGVMRGDDVNVPDIRSVEMVNAKPIARLSVKTDSQENGYTALIDRYGMQCDRGYDRNLLFPYDFPRYEKAWKVKPGMPLPLGSDPGSGV